MPARVNSANHATKSDSFVHSSRKFLADISCVSPLKDLLKSNFFYEHPSNLPAMGIKLTFNNEFVVLAPLPFHKSTRVL